MSVHAASVYRCVSVNTPKMSETPCKGPGRGAWGCSVCEGGSGPAAASLDCSGALGWLLLKQIQFSPKVKHTHM